MIGVVGDVKQYTLDTDSRIAMYLAAHAVSAPRDERRRCSSEAAPAAADRPPSATRSDSSIPTCPIYNVRTMDDRVDESLARRRFAMQLLTLFALVALGLGDDRHLRRDAYLVSQGTRELGIRLALGATPRGILWLIGRQTAVIAAVGVGARRRGRVRPHALHAEPAVRHPRQRSADVRGDRRVPRLRVALLAGYVPARRAARIDPVVSLRAE